MKYLLPWGVTMTYDELKDWYIMHYYSTDELAFGFWLEFKIECGAIREVRE
jgi:hypothetical protein